MYPFHLRRNHVRMRRRGGQRHGGRDRWREGLEGVEGGDARGLGAQAIRRGGLSDGHRAGQRQGSPEWIYLYVIYLRTAAKCDQ